MKRKALVFLIGVVVALAALEGGLRLVGFVYRVTEGPGRPAPVLRDRNTKVILCLGNSYTEGIGASAGMSYPEQLQRILGKEMPGARVQVINGGKRAQNSAELLSRLTEDLDTHKPDLVILQTGQPNAWILTGYDDYLERENPGKGSSSRVMRRLTRGLSYSRVYRLFLLWHNAARRKAAQPWFSLDEYAERYGDPGYSEAAQFIKAINFPFREVRREDVPPAVIERARAILKNAVAKDPGYPFNYIYIGDTYRFEGKYEDAADWYMKSLEVDNRTKSEGEYHIGYQALRQLRKRPKGPDQSHVDDEIDAFVTVFRKKHPKESVNFFLLRTDEIARWTSSDLEEIVRTIRGREIPLILQNYPIDTDANEALREVAERHSIPFVDNKKIFDGKLAGGAKKEDLFVPDEHCNDAGYRLMAENIYRKMVEEKLPG